MASEKPVSGSPERGVKNERWTVEKIIKWVKENSEGKLWRVKVIDYGEDRAAELLIGRVHTRDNTRTFPAVVVRVKSGEYTRDYVIPVRAMYYLFDFIGDPKMVHVKRFVNELASSIQPRKVNEEEEELGE